MQEAIMALVFIAIDPDTTGDHCPAVFVEEETGDLLFQCASGAPESYPSHSQTSRGSNTR